METAKDATDSVSNIVPWVLKFLAKVSKISEIFVYQSACSKQIFIQAIFSEAFFYAVHIHFFTNFPHCCSKNLSVVETFFGNILESWHKKLLLKKNI